MATWLPWALECRLARQETCINLHPCCCQSTAINTSMLVPRAHLGVQPHSRAALKPEAHSPAPCWPHPPATLLMHAGASWPTATLQPRSCCQMTSLTWTPARPAAQPQTCSCTATTAAWCAQVSAGCAACGGVRWAHRHTCQVLVTGQQGISSRHLVGLIPPYWVHKARTM